MDQPCSSTFPSSPPDLSIVPANAFKNCQVCGKQGHGNHFGAITCRACAAFFRRFGISNNFKPCTLNKKCGEPRNGWFSCKMCRLQRCKDIGMTSDNFQFQRDSFHSKEAKKILEGLENKITPTMDTFLGRSNLIIYCARHPDEKSDKKFINVQFLIDKASEVLSKDVETPVVAPSSLEKLALGLQKVQRNNPNKNTRYITRVGKEETFELWEYDVLKVAKWLTYFDEFQELPHKLKLDMLKGIWIIWSRLEKMATVAKARKTNIVRSNQVLLEFNDDQIIFEMGKLEIDLSWCSKYSFEQLKFFGCPKPERVESMVDLMIALEPTDVELTFMLCQLCLHHVGKRHQGEILEVCERLQDSLSNDLHDYYANRMRMTKYSDRIASMMKINNAIQQGINQRREKVEFMKIFDVFYVEYSDPEMFLDF
ncbi:unnamed protein product [Caenorhabditis brenneri]